MRCILSAALLGLSLPSPAFAQPAKVIVQNDVVYGKVHGAGLLADIAYPEGKGPFPVILSVHGGRWVGSHRNDPGEGAIDVQKWAGFGLFAMSIDYRLVGCTPPPACYQDVQCAIRWVHANKDKYPIDAERIFLIGMSAGGHLVSLAATLGDGPFARSGGWDKHSNAIRGVISLSGPYDLEKLSWGNLWKPAGDQLAARRLASPIRHVSAKTTPILILHSDNDGSVPVQQALEMAKALDDANARHRLSVHQKKGHMRITEHVIKETRAFIEEIGKGKPDQRMFFPGKDWDIVAADAEGLDAGKLAKAVEYLKANSGNDGVRELVVVRRGRIVWHGDNIDKVHGIWSCTKSFTSTLLGLLIDLMRCALETLAAEHVPALKDRYSGVTLRHFTTMTSGYRAVGDAEAKGSYLHGPSATPFDPAERLFAPGEKYAYWDSAMNTFGLALTKIAGEPLDALLKRRIMDPIGADPKQWKWGVRNEVKDVRVNSGSGNAGGSVQISARELARFGHLMLNRGNWDGKQLISAKWVEQATSVQAPAHLPNAHPKGQIDGSGQYGYNWWVNGTNQAGKRKWPDAPARTFAALGFNNNRMWIIPEWQMVIVRLGLDQAQREINDAVTNEFLKRVGEAIVDGVRTEPQENAKAPPRKRGTATVELTRPERFPHRIWAACDFEARTPDYAWFGPAETKNIPIYPGNITALGVKEKPYRNFSALMTGINPVPGPMMGKLNKMYCRYYLQGGAEATFQHFSLTVNDNNHIRVSGLTEGKWSEVTLNFTRDAARNDGSAKAFERGERMDDLKVFVGEPKDGKDYALFLDDIIFFDDDADMPRQTEPFPNRVIFQASFDTGIDAKSRQKYWPGAFEILTKSKGAPDDSYWGVARAVPHQATPHKDTKGKWIRLQIKPERPVGAHTKLRFRYFLKGARDMTVQVFDVTDGDNRHIHMKGLKEDAWQWAILDFTSNAKRNDGRVTPFAAGHNVDDIFFLVRPQGDQEVQLYVDEVTLFDAGNVAK